MDDKLTGQGNRERSSQGCTSAHTWAGEIESEAKMWLAMYRHTERKTLWNDLHFSAQSVARMYPTVLGNWLRQTWTRGGGGGGMEQRGGGGEIERGGREGVWL